MSTATSITHNCGISVVLCAVGPSNSFPHCLDPIGTCLFTTTGMTTCPKTVPAESRRISAQLYSKRRATGTCRCMFTGTSTPSNPGQRNTTVFCTVCTVSTRLRGATASEDSVGELFLMPSTMDKKNCRCMSTGTSTPGVSKAPLDPLHNLKHGVPTHWNLVQHDV